MPILEIISQDTLHTCRTPIHPLDHNSTTLIETKVVIVILEIFRMYFVGIRVKGNLICPVRTPILLLGTSSLQDKMIYARELKGYKEWLAHTLRNKMPRRRRVQGNYHIGGSDDHSDRAPLDVASQAVFLYDTDVGCLGRKQAVAQKLMAGPSDGTHSMVGTVVVGDPRSLPA